MPNIGGYELYTIETGMFGLDGGAMFGIVPKPLWEKKINADSQNRIPLAMRCLLLIGHGKVILIDNGLGHKYDEKFANIFTVDHSKHTLESSLAKVGIAPSDVTDVILTHLHFDHCGGSTAYKKDKLTLTFNNALHHVQQTQWVWTENPNPREKNSFLTENLEPLADSGQLSLLDGNTCLFPNFETLVVNGHTQGQQMVKISDETNTLVYVADLLPTHAHLPLAWVMGYDLFPLTTIDEKRTFLKEATENNWQLFFEHDPIVEVASLQQTERGIVPIHPRPLLEL